MNVKLLTDQSMPEDFLKDIFKTLLYKKNKDIDTYNWFQSIQFEILKEENTLIIYFPHYFFAEWFRMNLSTEFENFIFKKFSFIKKIEYKTNQQSSNNKNIILSYKRNKNYTFDNFLYNHKNYISFITAYNLAQNKIINNNPFIICGEKGSGKTHLINAIANEIISNRKLKEILLLNVDQLNYIYKSYKKLNVRNKIYNSDAFILDNIQHLEAFPHLQQELIYIYDYFLDNKKQMVFACTGRFANYDFLDHALKSRLEGGLFAYLKRPDLDIRIRYLQNQCQQKGLNLDENQMIYLAQNFYDFQSLHSINLKLLTQKEFKTTVITNESLENLVRDILSSTSVQPNSDQILNTVADYFQISTKELKSQQRSRKLVLARQIGMYLCRKLINCSYAQIGSVFGRDHSTVIYSLKKINKLQNDSKHIQNMLKELSQLCRKIRA